MMGWENAFHCEINPFGRAVLEYWFPNSKSYEDITKTDFREWRGKIDILTGGFPCQPFSYAGKRGGREDERYLWPEMLRVIDEVRPTWVVGENVAGITTMVEEGVLTPMGCDTTLFGEGDGLHRYELRQRFTIERICRDLEGLGYSVQPVLIPAAAVGAPHRRDRVFIVAHASDADHRDDVRVAGEHEGEGEGEGLSERHSIRKPGESDKLRSEVQGTTPYANHIGWQWGDFGLRKGEKDKTRQDGDMYDTITPISGRRDASHPYGAGLQAARPELQAAGNRRGREEDAADPDCERRKEPLLSKREKVSEEEREGLDDRTERSGRNGHAADTISERLQAALQPRGDGKKGRNGERRHAFLTSDDTWLKGTWWDNFPTVSPVHRGNDGIPFPVDRLTVPPIPKPQTYGKGSPKQYPFGKWRTESLKAYGNAIVPQVMYRIFQAIEETERQ